MHILRSSTEIYSIVILERIKIILEIKSHAFQDDSLADNIEFPGEQSSAGLSHLTNDSASYLSYSDYLTDFIAYRRIHNRDLLTRSPTPYDHWEVRVRAQRHEMIAGRERDRQVTAFASLNALADLRHRGICEDEDSRIQRSLGEGKNWRGHVTGYATSTVAGRIVPTPTQRLPPLDDVKKHDVQTGAPGKHVLADPNYFLDYTTAYPAG